MKKAVKVCSVLCAVIALLSLVFGIRALTGHNLIIGLRLFDLAAKGSFMGFIGNIAGIALTCLGFGALAYFGFQDTQAARKNGFIYGAIMTAVCVISMLAAIFSHTFTLGDLFITAIPAVYTFALIKTA